LTPAVFVLFVAVSPAVHAQDVVRRPVHAGSTSIHDVDAGLAGLSAGVAERVPVPSVWPMQAPSVALAGLAARLWIVVVLATIFTLVGVGSFRRDRAPPRRGLLVRI
jgi:hypothetical protein